MIQPAGRFAPSPTGPLHSGSLLAAVASFLDARSRGQRWLVRIDDLDAPRNVPGSDTAILNSLEAHGLHWDGPVIRQSQHLSRFESAIDTLAARGQIFYCTCSRSQLRGKTRYPGTCREHRAPRGNAAIRVRVDTTPVRFDDLIEGPQSEVLAETCGDFVIRRRDGYIAYQLATAVDDGDEAITRVVRGGDLLGNTARQIFLMQRLGLSAPAYAHLPTLVGSDGAKLSKQTRAPALDDTRPNANLLAVLPHLGLKPPADAGDALPAELLAWAMPEFSLTRIRGGEVVFQV